MERVKRGFENFLGGRSDFGVGLVDPDVEWDASELAVPDISGVYRGPEEVSRFWREWLAAWETVQLEYRLADAGDRVVALIERSVDARTLDRH